MGAYVACLYEHSWAVYVCAGPWTSIDVLAFTSRVHVRHHACSFASMHKQVYKFLQFEHARAWTSMHVCMGMSLWRMSSIEKHIFRSEEAFSLEMS